ncbi:MAG: hypothetical protein PHH06_00910 [Candidatus Gracilibacteria bacterium]|nr:hypothetical protein [Candidatus Gracilibacteria bacterium]
MSSEQFKSHEQSQDKIEKQTTYVEQSSEAFSIKEIKEKYGDYNIGVDVFEKYLNLLENKDLKKQILTVFSSRDEKIIDKVTNFILIDGFPNEQTIDKFTKDIGIILNNKDTQEQKADTQEQKAEAQEQKADTQEQKAEAQEQKAEAQEKKEANIQSLKDIYSKVGNKLDPDLESVKLLKQLSEGNNDVYDSLRNLLLKDDKQLTALLDAFKKHDEENGTHLYDSFKNTLTSIDKNFAGRIQAYEVKKDGLPAIKSDFKKAQIIAGLGTTDFEQDGTVFKAGDVQIDAGKIPPERFISNGDYKLETDLPVGDFYPATVEYERTKQEIEPQINSIKSLQKKEVQEHIKDMRDSGMNFVQAKSNLQNIYGIKLDFAITYEDLNPINLETKLKELESKMDNAKKRYETMLRDAIQTYSDKLKEKDKKTRETLTFLHSIGFDRVPQSVTDTIIDQINLNKGAYGLNTQIDLKNGVLGFSDAIEGNSPVEKEKFIRLFNKMISGDPEKPVPLTISTGTMGAIQPEQLKVILESELMSVGAVGKAMENLKKEYK